MDLDETMLQTVEAAYGEHAKRWGVSEDLLAYIAELVHGLILVTVRANTDKKDQHKLRSLKPLKIPRPWDTEKQSAIPALSMREMAQRMVGG